MNLIKKIQEWSKKAIDGKEGYDMVFVIPERNQFAYILKGHKFDIQECAIAIWKDDKIVQSYFVDNKEKIEGTTLSVAITKEKPVSFKVITKMEEKMILIDSENNVYSFGFNEEEEKEKEYSKTDVMIFYCINNIGTFLVASSQSPEIKVISYKIEKEPDAMKLFVKMIIEVFKKEEKKEIIKTENKELIGEVIVDGK